MINQKLNEFLKYNQVFKTSDLVKFLTDNVPTDKGKATNFANVSINRMKNENDNEGRVVTRIDKGVYAVGKLTIDQIWEVNKTVHSDKLYEYKEILKNDLKDKKILPAGKSLAYENGYSSQSVSTLFFSSRNFLKKYKEIEINELGIYSFIENNKEIYNSFPDTDDFLIRRIISSLDYVDVDSVECMSNLIAYLESNNINFIKLILFTIKEYNTKLNGRRYFESFMKTYYEIKK